MNNYEIRNLKSHMDEGTDKIGTRNEINQLNQKKVNSAIKYLVCSYEKERKVPLVSDSTKIHHKKRKKGEFDKGLV